MQYEENNRKHILCKVAEFINSNSESLEDVIGILSVYASENDIRNEEVALYMQVAVAEIDKLTQSDDPIEIDESDDIPIEIDENFANGTEVPQWYPRKEDYPVTKHICDCGTDAISVCQLLLRNKALKNYYEIISVLMLTLSILERVLPNSSDLWIRNENSASNIFNKLREVLETSFTSNEIDYGTCKAIEHDLEIVKKIIRRINSGLIPALEI